MEKLKSKSKIIDADSKTLVFKVLRARFGIADLYFLVADFECKTKCWVKENEKNYARIKEGEHFACSYAWALIEPNGIVKYNTYRGEHAAQYFIDEALSIYDRIY